MSSWVKLAYARAMRVARSTAKPVLPWLERRNENNDVLLWLRSLFAIWDIEDLIHIDCPWWTVAATRKVDRFLQLRPFARVFEWGCGASTVWLSKRAAEVISVEHDPPWYQTVRSFVATWPSTRLVYVPVERSQDPDAIRSGKPAWKDFDFRRYVSAIDQADGQFDLIVIDGRCRAECLERATQRLTPDGLLVFDNSRRRRYRLALRRSGLHALRTGPLSFCLPYPNYTTLLSPSLAVMKRLSLN